MNAQQLQQHYQRERMTGLRHVGRELDRMCLELGLDPETTWRRPRRHRAIARAGAGLRAIGPAMRGFQAAINKLTETLEQQQRTYSWRYQDGRKIKGPSMHDGGVTVDLQSGSRYFRPHG